MKDTVSLRRKNMKQIEKQYSWKDIDFIVRQLAVKIRNSDRMENYNSIYGVPRGGLIVAVMLSHRLDLPVVDSRGINDGTLIVDDIADSGETLEELNRAFPNCDTAVLHLKSHSIFKPKFYVVEIFENEWIKYPWEVI